MLWYKECPEILTVLARWISENNESSLSVLSLKSGPWYSLSLGTSGGVTLRGNVLERFIRGDDSKFLRKNRI